MNCWQSLGIIWLASALAMAALWAFSMRVRNVGYVDVGWAGLMALAALFAGIVGEGAPLVRGLVAMFGSVWGARLCLHLLHRVLNEEEDGRYRALREAWNGSPARFFARHRFGFLLSRQGQQSACFHAVDVGFNKRIWVTAQQSYQHLVK